MALIDMISNLQCNDLHCTKFWHFVSILTFAVISCSLALWVIIHFFSICGDNLSPNKTLFIVLSDMKARRQTFLSVVVIVYYGMVTGSHQTFFLKKFSWLSNCHDIYSAPSLFVFWTSTEKCISISIKRLLI